MNALDTDLSEREEDRARSWADAFGGVDPVCQGIDRVLMAKRSKKMASGS